MMGSISCILRLLFLCWQAQSHQPIYYFSTSQQPEMEPCASINTRCTGLRKKQLVCEIVVTWVPEYGLRYWFTLIAKLFLVPQHQEAARQMSSTETHL